tara:strand:- start:33 stop:623 length:591 start_codon:yes stop_codon:yes gene_type:complete
MIIDLFSGSGSATGIWQTKGFHVERYDIIAPKKPITWAIDLSNKEQCNVIIRTTMKTLIKGYNETKPLLIWASPPCTEYSLENRYFAKNPQEINTTLWRNTKYIIDSLEPKYWVIENVKGAHRIWGQPTQKFGAYWLWGNFPKFNIPGKVPNKNVHNYKNKKERARKSAKIPFEISNGLYKAIALQKTLFTPDYCL